MDTQQRRFRVVVEVDARGRVSVPIPFDPDEAWGVKSRHPVRGSVAGRSMRGNVVRDSDRPVLTLGPAWSADPPSDGTEVEVVLEPEGPQRSELAADIASALDAAPEAGAFFDSLAQFYRKGWLRWIDSTMRHPEQRPERIAEMVRHLQAGRKERPAVAPSDADASSGSLA